MRRRARTARKPGFSPAARDMIESRRWRRKQPLPHQGVVELDAVRPVAGSEATDLDARVNVPGEAMFGAITALSGIGGSGGEREDCDDEDPAHVSPLAPPRQTRTEAACSGMTFWFLLSGSPAYMRVPAAVAPRSTLILRPEARGTDPGLARSESSQRGCRPQKQPPGHYRHPSTLARFARSLLGMTALAPRCKCASCLRRQKFQNVFPSSISRAASPSPPWRSTISPGILSFSALPISA